MPSHVLYQIPYATWPVRLVMGAVGLFFVLAIFGWWLPKAIRLLRSLAGKSVAQAIASVAVAVIPLVLGFGPLVVLIGLIRNPMSYVTDTGVMQESVFHQGPVSFAWGEIQHVHCRLGRDGTVTMISVIAYDRRRLELGNTGGVDFASMHELFLNQLGPVVVRPCERGSSERPR